MVVHNEPIFMYAKSETLSTKQHSDIEVISNYKKYCWLRGERRTVELTEGTRSTVSTLAVEDHPLSMFEIIPGYLVHIHSNILKKQIHSASAF